MQVSEQPLKVEQPAAEQPADASRVVAKNTAYLALGQLVAMPLSALVNAMLARFLGAAEFGYMYLAGTMCSFGILIVEWGQQGALPALVARDRANAGALLGTGLAWRFSLSLLVYAALATASVILQYQVDFQWILALSFAGALINSVAGGIKDTIRGFERADIPAIAHVGQQLLWAMVAIPLLLAGVGIRGVLAGAVLVALATAWQLTRALHRVGVGALAVRRPPLAPLLAMGTPFVFFDLATALQPNIDAMFLARYASGETIGWFAVSRRLIGLLILPATALIGGLYPTLCRLWVESRDEFVNTARGALKSVTVLALPAALGCALYPEVGIAIFSRKLFGPAADNLRVMSLFLFLIYFTMPIGSAVLAAGRQRLWSFIQVLCVGVSLTVNPLLIPWFQKQYGNGGLGPCVVAVISELIVLTGGIVLAPRGVLDRSLLRTLLLSAPAGAAMVGVALVTKSLTPFLAAPLAAIAYFAVALSNGAITESQRTRVLGFLRRKLGRFVGG